MIDEILVAYFAILNLFGYIIKMYTGRIKPDYIQKLREGGWKELLDKPRPCIIIGIYPFMYIIIPFRSMNQMIPSHKYLKFNLDFSKIMIFFTRQALEMAVDYKSPNGGVIPINKPRVEDRKDGYIYSDLKDIRNNPYRILELLFDCIDTYLKGTNSDLNKYSTLQYYPHEIIEGIHTILKAILAKKNVTGS